jgi:hypothetical protein
MSMFWGGLTQAYVGAKKGAREQDQRDEEIAQRKRDSAIQRAAMLAGLGEKGIGQTAGPGAVALGDTGYYQDPTQTPQSVAKAVQANTTRQRIATLRRNPELSTYSDDELAGIAADEPTYREMMKPKPPKEKGVMLDASGKPTIYDKENPQFAPDFVGPHAAPPTQPLDERLHARVQELVKSGVSLQQASEQARSEYGQTNPKDTAGQSPMTVQRALTLQGHFNSDPVVKDAAQVATAYQKVKASAAQPSAAGDMSLLYNMNKMFDPGSVVRESEFANAAKTGSLDQRVQGYVLRVANGQRLTPEQRADFMNAAAQILRAQHAQFQSSFKRYSEQATRHGVDPRDVVYDPFEGLTETAGTGTPKATGGGAFGDLIPKKKAPP